ncbi:serine/threonine-protein phosphatase 7 long form homolog [Hibiscus syriacus]|uniref:serine/threonine-protein phosphatase 7 long form homolog n=1 Tax=Hibiscus syriacus TaxID=106335 RepID=UPI0019244C40|nr:serine/threonine-protein phosphatase 7 long form homolog [Hibiscus syriacus]
MASSSLLRLQENHISSFVFQEDTCRILRSRRIYFEEPHPYIINYLKMSGFYNASQVRRFVLLPDLISALIERWRPETHTFHFPFGECTITLEDVALQLGLPIDGMAVTGCSLLDWKDECQNLLGVVPPEEHLNGSRVKLTWLQSTFQHLPENASEKDIKYAARAYILRLIGGVLMPDKSGNLVHLMYLPLLRDFKLAGTYSWGSACLGFLYRELCRATIPKTHDIGGCLVLLQSWAWYRLPFLAPRTATAPVYPLASRWNSRKVHPGIPSGLPSIREQLDRLEYDKFIWMPYSSKEILVCLPIEAYNHCHLWNTNTALICFAVVAWHQTDRVCDNSGCNNRSLKCL